MNRFGYIMDDHKIDALLSGVSMAISLLPRDRYNDIIAIMYDLRHPHTVSMVRNDVKHEIRGNIPSLEWVGE